MKKLYFLTFCLTLFYSVFIIPQQKIALHFSDATNFSEPTAVLEKITYWELFLLNNKIKYDVIYDKNLRAGISGNKYHTIIFPYTKVIDEKSFNSILKFKEQNGNIIAFGEFCYFNSDTSKRNYEWFTSIFNSIELGKILKKEMSIHAAINFHSVLNNNINDTTYIQVSAKNSPVVIEKLSDNLITLCAVKTDSSTLFYNKPIAILNDSYNSKSLWFSFDALDVISGKQDINRIESIILNALEWCAKSVSD